MLVTRSFEMTALPESCSAASSAELAQSSAAERGGHGVRGEQRGLPPAGRYCLISVVVNVQNAVTSPDSVLFVFVCRMGSWSSQALLLEARACCFPANPWWRGERRQEAGGRGWDGREGAAPTRAVLTKKSRITPFDSALCLSWSVYSMCVWGREQMASEWWWIAKGKLREVVSERDLKEEKTLSFKNSVNITKTNSSWYSSRGVFYVAMLQRRNFGSFRFCCLLVIGLIYIRSLFWFCLLIACELLAFVSQDQKLTVNYYNL